MSLHIIVKKQKKRNKKLKYKTIAKRWKTKNKLMDRRIKK